MDFDQADYVTVGDTNDPHQFIVLLMRWSKTEDGHIAVKVSTRMKREAADVVAQRWASTAKVEVR